ncbi:hypothetical protein B0T21DRAFT_364823 [Apiosordaria backusii]|uniref:Uncharacterized protein n=1 Tax=Apiosordaria backusii TaxID=314023 RepID=A0AA40BNA4_9PEZI|nr:hypothetical protein B0T21DRAFT_364823 [Apiosordaria backusii]
MASLFTHLGAHRSSHTLPPPTPTSINTDLSRHTSVQSRSSRSPTTWSPGLPQRSLPLQQQHQRPVSETPLAMTPEQRTALEHQFAGLHADLTSEARLLLGEIQAIQQTLPGSLSETEKDEDIITFLQNLVHGKISSALSPPTPSFQPGKDSHIKSDKPLRAIRTISRDIETRLGKEDRFGAIGVAIDDLRSAVGDDADYPDEERERRAWERMELIQSAMPEGETYDKFWVEVAMHLDHELPIPASAEYSNLATFNAGVPVRDIPRERFLATNDGYAWDMEELAGEIVARGGEFNNPVTGRKFEEEDVELIKGHPLGRSIDEAVRVAARQQEEIQGKAEMDGQGKEEERWEAKLSAQWAKQMHQTIKEKAAKERESVGLISGGKLKLHVSSPGHTRASAVELPSATTPGSQVGPSKTISFQAQLKKGSSFPDWTTIAELPGSSARENDLAQPVGREASAGQNPLKDDVGPESKSDK